MVCPPVQEDNPRALASGLSPVQTDKYFVMKFAISVEDDITKIRTIHFKAKKKIVADDILIFYFYLSDKIRLDFSCESSA